FVIDNLPPSLVPEVADLAEAQGGTIERMALVVGPGRYHEEVVEHIRQLRDRLDDLKILFLDASTETLVRRYESTRRRHPFATGGGTVGDAIEAERLVLGSVRAEADLFIDTSDLNVHQLRDRINEAFGDHEDVPGMRTTVMSFGYKYGLPLDVDLVLDCRFIPNPYWERELRPLSGLDEPVSRFVLDQAVTGEFLARLEDLMAVLLPSYVAEGKSYLTLAFGCTGGRHRSVAIAQRAGEMLDRLGHASAMVHRDIDK
ncbi:MAG: RNase adapter RapZ, partial [Acidimicrobiales bacterium]